MIMWHSCTQIPLNGEIMTRNWVFILGPTLEVNAYMKYRVYKAIAQLSSSSSYWTKGAKGLKKTTLENLSTFFWIDG